MGEDKLSDLIDQADHHIIQKIFLPPGLRVIKSYGVIRVMVSTRLKQGIAQQSITQFLKMLQSLRQQHIQTLLRRYGVPTLPQSSNVFLWKIVSRAIAVNANLRHGRINVDRFCSRCCMHKETSDHVLFSCQYAETVW